MSQWNDAALQGVRDAKLGAPMAARTLAIVHTCIYDAWAAYDERAVGTQLRGALRRPPSERTLANKRSAISYAAFRALEDVLPVDKDSVYVPPFGMTKGEELREAVGRRPAEYGSAEYQQQAEEMIALSAGLADRQKMISESWADGPNSEQPPGHWLRFAQFISARDRHTLDDDEKKYFTLTNAMPNAGISP